MVLFSGSGCWKCDAGLEVKLLHEGNKMADAVSGLGGHGRRTVMVTRKVILLLEAVLLLVVTVT